MEIYLLQSFLTIAKEKNITKAAEKLHMTQSALSKQLQRLESAFGLPLFIRSINNFTLTDAGQILLPFARDVVHKVSESKSAIDKLRTQEEIIRIASGYFVGVNFLPEIILRFTRLFTNYRLVVEFLGEDETLAAVENNNVDLGINTLHNLSNSHFKTTYLWQCELKLVVAKDHPLATLKKPTLEDIAKYPGITPPRNTPIREQVDKLFTGQALTAQIDIIINNNLLACKRICGAGLGWSVLPTEIIDQDFVVLSIPTEFYSKFYLIQNPAKQFSEAATGFIDCLASAGLKN